MMYFWLILAVVYWTAFPRRFFASPLPLWLLTWALILGVYLTNDFHPQAKVLGITQPGASLPDQKIYYDREIARMWNIVHTQAPLRDEWLYLGWLEANFGSKEKAGEALRSLQQIDPNHPETLHLEKWLADQ